MFSTHKLRLYYADALAVCHEYSESATDFLAGVGVSFMVAEVYALRAEWFACSTQAMRITAKVMSIW